jgi:hypothetical protein
MSDLLCGWFCVFIGWRHVLALNLSPCRGTGQRVAAELLKQVFDAASWPLAVHRAE